jgi:MFS family permease
MIGRRDDLSSAIALNSSMVNAARLLGPSIAGIVIAAVGEGYCYLIDGFSYVAVIISLLLMSISVAEKRQPRAVLEELREGWNYVGNFSPVRSILLLLVVASLMGMPFTVLMPIFAGSVLHGGPHTLGFLMGSVGVGALLSAAYLASRRTVIGLGRIIPISAALFGAGLIAFSLSRWLWLSMLLLLITGAGMMQQMAASNTMLQTIVDDDKRGRLMSFYSVSIMGMTPFGSLLAGFLASRITAPGALLVGGICCLLGAAWFARQLPSLRVLVRPIYVRLGILPEIATGIQQASVVQEE